MSKPVTDEFLSVLPIHDADVISCNIVMGPRCERTLRLVFTLHPDESAEALIGLGINSRSVGLAFEHCWQVVTNLIGSNAGDETIDDWFLVEDSELLKFLEQHGLARGFPLKHHRFLFSGGSRIDLLAEQAWIEEFVP